VSQGDFGVKQKLYHLKKEVGGFFDTPFDLRRLIFSKMDVDKAHLSYLLCLYVCNVGTKGIP
jgi:hypothetical protein